VRVDERGSIFDQFMIINEHGVFKNLSVACKKTKRLRDRWGKEEGQRRDRGGTIISSLLRSRAK
jgi:hypothetical protein